MIRSSLILVEPKSTLARRRLHRDPLPPMRLRQPVVDFDRVGLRHEVQATMADELAVGLSDHRPRAVILALPMFSRPRHHTLGALARNDGRARQIPRCIWAGEVARQAVEIVAFERA